MASMSPCPLGFPHRNSPREDLLPKEPVASLRHRHLPWRVAVPAQHPCSRPSAQGCLPTPEWLPRIWWDGLTNRDPLLRGLPNTVQSWPHGLCPTFWPHSRPPLLQPHHCLTSGHKHRHICPHKQTHTCTQGHEHTRTHTDTGTCVHTHTILTHTGTRMQRYTGTQTGRQRAPACVGLG